MNRDIVVIGASAGGVEVLLDIVRGLPADLAAAVFVVVHLPSDRKSSLPELLTRRGPLPAKHPLHDEQIKHGTIYVAPPDMHLQLRAGHIEVVRGPKDNGHRPAVDTLFRTAASAYGARVIGVVLSGYQDCGTAGMMSIKARGGRTIAQDPATAYAAEMPRHVIERVGVDHVVTPHELPATIVQEIAMPAGATVAPDQVIQQLDGVALGAPADVVCPICDGVLTESHPGVFQHFRCHVGHAFTLESLVREQSDGLERVMWSAVRSLEESARLARRLSITEQGDVSQRFAEKADLHQQEADYLRQLILHSQNLSREDAKKVG